MEMLQTPFKPSQMPHTMLSSSQVVSLLPKLSSISLTHDSPPPSLFIRCGGGPRTYPGGVSKWQWKRMQSKKAKQLLKARLARERSIYEMRKRAELKAAVSDLERPWEIASSSSSSSSLFSVSADEQLKVLADRFQKPGGFDLWSHNDGPQVFYGDDNTTHDLPSSRFFPKGVVHSVKPYYGGDPGKIDAGVNPNRRRLRADDGDGGNTIEDSKVKPKNGTRLRSGVENSRLNNRRRLRADDGDGGNTIEDSKVKPKNGTRLRSGVENSRLKAANGNRKEMIRSENAQMLDAKQDRNGRKNRGQNSGKLREFNAQGEGVYDMSLQGDGSYGFSGRNHE